MPEKTIDETEANRIAVRMFGRVIAFFVYSFFSIIIAGVIFALATSWLTDDISTWMAIGFFLICEGLLIVLLSSGRIQAARSVFAAGESFTESQFAFVANALALVSFLFSRSESGELFRWLVNAAILLCVLVFFITKSIVMRRVRLKILTGAIIPLAQFMM